MKYLKYSLILFSFIAFLSFIGEDTARTSEGVQIGNTPPSFILSDNTEEISLKSFKGQYILINFWAAYDAESRATNIRLWNQLRKLNRKDVVMISVSFDEYESIYQETIKMDGINNIIQLSETEGENSVLYKKYRLQEGFKSFLLDQSGRIMAKEIHPEYLHTLFLN
ncbi:MAG: thioredoxin family protein [Candidatus Azobacteroides sp.]|nr:thioredoxin family protein [Candidatus Azobacteroides sp.]